MKSEREKERGRENNAANRKKLMKFPFICSKTDGRRIHSYIGMLLHSV